MKVLASLTMVFVLLFGIIAGTGCYLIQASTKREIVGTYELTSYSTRTNQIEEKGIECYLVVTDNGGYFAYKDNETPAYYHTLSTRYIANQEDSNKYDYVEFGFDNSLTWTKFGVAKKQLNFSKMVMKGNIFEGTWQQDYTISVKFSKVNRAKDMSYVKKELGSDIKEIPYGSKALSGLYEFSYFDGIDYNLLEEARYEESVVYSYFNLDVLAGTVDVYYMLKEDEVRVQRTYPLTLTGSDCNFNVTIGEKTYEMEVTSSRKTMKIPETLTYNDETYTFTWRYNCIGLIEHYDLETTIQNFIDRYEASKTPVEEE